MASKPKNAARGKNTGGRGSAGARNSTAGGSQEVSFGSEVALLVILAACIVLFISNFGIGGFIGAKVSGFCFGLFGMMAYLFPVCFFVGAAFFVSNRENRAATVKLAAGVVLVVFLCLFMELVAGDSSGFGIKKSFQYAAEHKSGGGALGGMFASVLCPAIGKVGAYVVDIIALIISLVLLTERSFLGGVKRGSRKMYDSAREDAARRREEKELRREEQEVQRRIDRKAEGVALDTKILPASARRSDNISELKLPKETEALSKELREKLSVGKEEIQKSAVGNITGWTFREGVSPSSVVEMPSRAGISPSRRAMPEMGGIHVPLQGDVFREEGQGHLTQGIFSKAGEGSNAAQGVFSRKQETESALQGIFPREQETESVPQDACSGIGFVSQGGFPEPGRAEDIFTEPVVVEKVRKSPRKSRKSAGIPFGEEGTEQLWKPETEILLTREEPVVIHSEPSGMAGAGEGDALQGQGLTEAVFAGPGPAIVSGAAGEPEAAPLAGMSEERVARPAKAGMPEGGMAGPSMEGMPDGGVARPSMEEVPDDGVARPSMEGMPDDGMAQIPEVGGGAAEPSQMPESRESVGISQPESLAAGAAGASQTSGGGKAPEAASQTSGSGAAPKAASQGQASPQPARPPVPEPKKPYVFPPVSLLKKGTNAQGDSKIHLQETAIKLQQTLKNFGVNVTITDVSCGPSVTRYEMQPEMGVKVSKIVNLADDIKLNLAAADIRIEAPIPGKAAVGIEVPNKENVMVRFRDMVETREFQSHPSSICFTAGKDIGGQPVVADIAKMPHLLIAGATGSGKSVCINTIIMSILYKADPEDVKLILIDPKVVELSVYNGIPHLLIPVVTDPKKAAGALHWAVAEMMDRYQKFADCQVRDLKGYNQKIAAISHVEDEAKPTKMPQIVVVVDELADLMMVAPGDVEDAICRLAQLARAAGIHLIIATQRPSVDVITGLIKANMPSRIAFSVSSGVDSRTILDMNGAEKLLGNGDMLFYPQGFQKPLRVQGPFVSDPEVEAVVDFLKKQSTVVYNPEIEAKMASASSGSGPGAGGNERDAYFVEAGKFVIEKEKGSIGMLQRMFKVGFNRAARIMDQLEEAGVVGPEEGTKPRKILMSLAEFEQYVDEYV